MVDSTCSFCHLVLAHPPFIAFACGHVFHKGCMLAKMPEESRVHITPTSIEGQKPILGEISELKTQTLQVGKAASFGNLPSISKSLVS
jgi:hypothetical protein